MIKIKITGFIQQEDGSYVRESDNTKHANLEAVFQAVTAQWKFSREYIARHEAQYEAAKKASEAAKKGKLSELFPMLSTYKEMEQIEKEQDAILREIVRAQHTLDPDVSLPGTSKRLSDVVIIDEKAAIDYAIEVHPEWLMLTPAARAMIETAFSDRMHKSYGTLPEQLAKFVEDGKVIPVISDKELLNGKKNQHQGLLE